MNRSKLRLPLIILWGVIVITLALLAVAPADLVSAGHVTGVVADNLDHPRGMTFAPDGTLYIAESGRGGDGSDGRCIPGPGGGSFCYGATGAVTAVYSDGMQVRIVDDMASLATAPPTVTEAVGPQDVVVDANGDLYVIVGLGADPAVRDPNGPLGADGMNLGQLAMITEPTDEASGYGWMNVVDVAAHEASDPDGNGVDSNPYGLLALDDGFAVTDAGGNTLLHVDPMANAIITLSIFPTRTVEFPPGSGNMIPMQAVPTGLTGYDTSSVLVGQLTGFPFPLGGANVYSATTTAPGDPQIAKTGFTNILDVAMGADGSIYVLEMATNSLLSGDPTGAVKRVRPDGTITTLTTGLFLPTGMTIGPDGMLYVANNGIIVGNGQVVQIDPTVPTDVNLSGFGGETAGVTPMVYLLLGLVLLAPFAVLWLNRRQQQS